MLLEEAFTSENWIVRTDWNPVPLWLLTFPPVPSTGPNLPSQEGRRLGSRTPCCVCLQRWSAIEEEQECEVHQQETVKEVHRGKESRGKCLSCISHLHCIYRSNSMKSPGDNDYLHSSSFHTSKPGYPLSSVIIQAESSPASL